MDKFKVIAIIIAILVILLIIVLTSRERIYKTYQKYMKIGNKANLTGQQFAILSMKLLDMPYLNFSLTTTKLGDAYNPHYKCLIMSQQVCTTASLSALTIVAHELGHAMQDKMSLPIFYISMFFSKITNFTNKFIIPLLITGIFMFIFKYPNDSIGLTLILISSGMFIFHILNQILKVPVEYDASKRALKYLKENNFLTSNEIKKAKKLLSVAALTYVAGLFDSLFILNPNKKRRK